MIVISIILFLVTFSLFPYSYYMKRSYVERSIDSLGQEWIMAHKDVRNGKLFSEEKHAHIVLIFEKWTEWIGEYLMSWATLPPIGDFTRDPTNANIKFQKFSSFDTHIEVHGFRGFTGSTSVTKLGYLITAPYGSGVFFTDSSSTFTSTGIFLTIGYTWGSLKTGHARELLLRPYLR